MCLKISSAECIWFLLVEFFPPSHWNVKTFRSMWSKWGFEQTLKR